MNRDGLLAPTAPVQPLRWLGPVAVAAGAYLVVFLAVFGVLFILPVIAAVLVVIPVRWVVLLMQEARRVRV